MKITKSACAWCHGYCGVLVYVKDGKVVKVEGNPDCPLNRGTMCSKGLASVQILYHPDRLKHPLKRVGKRGEGKWEPISWDEALNTIAEKLKGIREKYGPNGVAFAGGTGRPIFPYVLRFIGVLGTTNRAGFAHNCFTPRLATAYVTFGRPIMYDPEHSRCIMVWGANVTHTNADANIAKIFIEGWKKGAKLICVDPLFTPIASKADLWLQIRPGTDCALALAMLNVIITEKLYNVSFVEKWTYGFDKLAEHVKKYSPEWAEGITWIPAVEIKSAARMYATTKPACLFSGVAPEFGVNVTNTIRSMWMLATATGNTDVPGGNVFWESPIKGVRFLPQDLISKEAWESRCSKDFKLHKYGFPGPTHSVYNTIVTEKPYPIKAFIAWACNALASHENAYRLVYKALMKVDFLVAVDQFMTPTAALADIVLPACTWLERDDVYFLFSGICHGMTFCCQKAIEPLGESKDDKEIMIELCRRLGHSYGWNSVRELLDWVLKPAGITFEKFKEVGWLHQTLRPKKYETGLLRPDGKPGFNTPSGKIELYSTELEQLGYNPLPVYKEPPESPYSSPELAKEYSLILTTGIRSPVFFHSQYRQVPWLREIHSEPIVRIHPETAWKLGIKDGDWVYIESPRGRCKQKALLFEGIDPRVVMAEHDWWFPEKPEVSLFGIWESNINILTSSDPPYDPALGSTPARSLLCKVYKAGD